MSNKIKVLVVDDSAFYRKIISEVLGMDSQIEVVGTAANGKIALDLIEKLNPDVMTLDLEMPEMDGIETLENIRKRNLQVGVIVFSAHSKEGAELTFSALEKGAFDFVTKPSRSSFSENINEIRLSLIPKIKACYLKRKLRTPPLKQIPDLLRNPSFPAIKKEVVGIGSSTGGPNALKKIFSRLSPHISSPIFIVQHMPPIFTRQFAESLDKMSQIKVKEAENGEKISERTAYIAPGDYHMEVEDERIRLHKGPPENNCRPSVDVLFRSMARTYGERTLAIILTGIGNDGLKGVKRLKEKGAYVIAQDEETSVVWGMPRAVVEEGLADKVLPLEQIPIAISKLVR